MTLTICYILHYAFDQTSMSKQCRPRWDAANAASHQGLHCLPLIQLFKTLKWVVNCTCSNFRLSIVKLLRSLNTKGKYGKVTGTEIKWSIISKSVMIIIFVVFIDQLIDYSINRASLAWLYLFIGSWCPWAWRSWWAWWWTTYRPRYVVLPGCFRWNIPFLSLWEEYVHCQCGK